MAIKKFPATVRMSSAFSTTTNLAVEAGGTRRDLVKSQFYFYHVFSCLQNGKVTVDVNCDVGKEFTPTRATMLDTTSGKVMRTWATGAAISVGTITLLGTTITVMTI